MQAFIHPLPYQDPEQVFSRFAGEPFSLFLDSADLVHPGAKRSFIAIRPAKTIICEAHDDPFGLLQKKYEWMRARYATPCPLPGFTGGLAGLFGYGLGSAVETLCSRHAPRGAIPDLAVGVYETVLSFDMRAQTLHLIVWDGTESGASRKKNAVLETLAGPQLESSADAVFRKDFSWRAEETEAAYRAKIQDVIDYILQGDIFQANLSQEFTCDLPPGFDAYAHYRFLRQINPAPYAAYFNLGAAQISSASPEQFLHMAQKKITTRPIKGTARRHDDPARDAQGMTELRESEKDRAENIMIVDLLRNDLSKVCLAETIDVPALCHLESFARVHHLVSSVTGTLRGEHTPIDLLKACFPGGSVTGAPKIRAMQIIDALETGRRGPYCGSIGYIGFDGTMDSNILIRTLVYEGGTANLRTGGGITALSDAAQEYRETLMKAEAIFKSFESFKQARAS